MLFNVYMKSLGGDPGGWGGGIVPRGMGVRQVWWNSDLLDAEVHVVPCGLTWGSLILTDS